ncbi:MAG: oligosaccharide flippase family protein [Alphaproteobacteria bacterium]|nr:oligosaccharide flippase family protein [Alphaproteobacteria bacterium]
MLRRLYTQLAGPSFGAIFARIAAGSALVQAAGMGLALIVGMLLARALGAHGLGIYSLGMSVVALLSVPTEFGLPTYLMREVATAHVRQDWGRLRTVVSWCTRAIFLSSIAVTVAACLCLAFAGPSIGQELTLTILAALPLVLLVALTKAREAALQGMNLQPLAQIPMLIGRPGTFLTVLALAVFGFGFALDASQAMMLHSFSMALVAAAITLLYRARISTRSSWPQDSTFDGRGAVRAALPMALTEGLRVMNGHIAIFMLGFLASPTAVGIYKVADAVCILCALPVFVLSNVVAPQIARLHVAGDVARLGSLVSYVALSMTVGSLAMAMPVVFFGIDILSLLFGPGFGDAYLPMIILCIGYAASAMMGPSLAYMNLTGREQTVTRAFAVSFLANLVLGAAAVSIAGATGAALTNVVCYLIWNGWLWREAKRQAKVDTSLLPAMQELLAWRRA